MKSVNIIIVKYLSPTNHKGTRVKLTSKRFEQSVTIPYDYTCNSSTEVAIKYLQEHEHNVWGYDGWLDAIVTLPTDGTFKPLKDK